MIYTYADLLKEFPIDENESVSDFVKRIPERIIKKYEITTNVKVIADGIRRELKRDRTIKVKRSETLINGNVVSEKFGYVKDVEEPDLNEFEIVKLTTNPNGSSWARYEKIKVDYIGAIKELFSNFKIDKKPKFESKKSKYALKITITDDHVGMSVKNSLFEYKYGKIEYYKSLDLVFAEILKEYKSNGRFDKIIFQNLGDALDGYNSETTRGGHKLEQNMSNNEAFTTYIKGKINLISNVLDSDICESVEVYDSVNCNHSGDFGFNASYACKLYLEKVYENLSYTIFEKFFEHFYYGEHCFIQTHGKDKQYMKSGLPLKLDDKTQKIITQYIDYNNISSKFIHVDKGDLHQIGYNKCKLFDYRNYMSFAPPSNWVQHNFGDGYSGFSMQVIDKENQIKHSDLFIDYQIKGN